MTKTRKSERTKARLLQAARDMVAQDGYAQLRVEEVTRRAEVSKATFFVYFESKEALVDALLGQALVAQVDALRHAAVPMTADALLEQLRPLMQLVGQDAYVTQMVAQAMVLRSHGDARHIPCAFQHLDAQLIEWFQSWAPDAGMTPRLRAEGVMAMLMQALGQGHCAMSGQISLAARLRHLLRAWLEPARAA